MANKKRGAFDPLKDFLKTDMGKLISLVLVVALFSYFFVSYVTTGGLVPALLAPASKMVGYDVYPADPYMSPAFLKSGQSDTFSLGGHKFRVYVEKYDPIVDNVRIQLTKDGRVVGLYHDVYDKPLPSSVTTMPMIYSIDTQLGAECYSSSDATVAGCYWAVYEKKPFTVDFCMTEEGKDIKVGGAEILGCTPMGYIEPCGIYRRTCLVGGTWNSISFTADACEVTEKCIKPDVIFEPKEQPTCLNGLIQCTSSQFCDAWGICQPIEQPTSIDLAPVVCGDGICDVGEDVDCADCLIECTPSVTRACVYDEISSGTQCAGTEHCNGDSHWGACIKVDPECGISVTDPINGDADVSGEAPVGAEWGAENTFLSCLSDSLCPEHNVVLGGTVSIIVVVIIGSWYFIVIRRKPSARRTYAAYTHDRGGRKKW